MLLRSVRRFRMGIKDIGMQLSQRLLGSKSFLITGIPLPSVKMDERIKWVVAKQKCDWQLPHSIQNYLHPTFSLPPEHVDYCYPEEGVLEIPNGTATALGANLTESGEVVSTFLSSLDANTVEQHNIYYFSLKRFFPRILCLNDPVISLADPWQGAFYHWMYQVLPRLGLVPKPYSKIYADQSFPFQQQSMELLGLKDHLIRTLDYDAVKGSKILATSSFLCPTHYSSRFLRESFLPVTPIYSKKRIYLSREDARTRRLINEAELLPILNEFGFEKVYFASLPFKEQIALLRSAQMVVAPHGAGLSHLVFCDPGTPVLEIFHSNYVNNCYWQLASIQKLPYYMLFDTQQSTQQDPDIYITPEQLRDGLEKMEYDWRHR